MSDNGGSICRIAANLPNDGLMGLKVVSVFNMFFKLAAFI